jgi:predicted ArsR family transcriptional regulator
MQRRILERMGKSPVNATWRAPELATALDVSVKSIRGELSYLAKKGVVERTVRGAYRLRTQAPSIPYSADHDHVVLSMYKEVAEALGITNPTAVPRSWNELINAMSALRKSAQWLSPRLADALGFPHNMPLDQAIEKVDEMRTYADGQRRSVLELEEQLENARNHIYVMERWKEDTETGLRALRATLDLVDPSGRKR